MGPTAVYINHSNLLHNFALIRENVQPAKVMAVVKANAYGHGSIEIAKSLQKEGADYLGVAFHEEGIELRKAGIKTPILVFGAQLPEFFEQLIEYEIDLTITHLDQLKKLQEIASKKGKKAGIHLKADTGMNRVGFYETDLYRAADIAFTSEQIAVKGIYSHLSSADEDDPDYTLLQIERFNKLKQYIEKQFPGEKPVYHLANSAAIMRFPQAYFDMVRPGVMLYGNPPAPGFKTDWDIREVMAFKSKVTLIKNVAENEPVSYNRRFYTKEISKIAVVPVGYADGYNRKLTNKGTVLIRGKRFAVVGTVCMDQILVNLGKDQSVKIGDEVVLFGQQDSQHIKITEIAEILETIPYEVTCWPSIRVNRIHQYNKQS